MEQFTAAVLIAVLFLLLGSGVWIGLSLLGVAWIAMEMFTVRPAGDAMAVTIWGSASSWTLTALPLFLWMGEILFRTRLSEDMFKGLAPWLERVPGRLLHINIVGCTIFAAVSGSSTATCATIGRITIPELMRLGYPREMTIGTLAGAGTLGLLIPPSIIMIVYAVTAEVSIASLFVAGVLPGVLLALLFSGYIVAWALVHPDRIPPAGAATSFTQMLHASRHMIPVVLLIGLVLGSIYTGIATATEAAALGVIGSLIIAGTQGTLTRKLFIDGLLAATRLYCMIALILAGATFPHTRHGIHRPATPSCPMDWRAGARPFRAAVRAHAFLHRAGLLPRRHLHGRAHDAGAAAHHSDRENRLALVRHLHRARRGDVADHAARGPQSVRAAGHDPAADHVDRATGVASIPADDRASVRDLFCPGAGDVAAAAVINRRADIIFFAPRRGAN
jgi:tripartite ATP-independent transporter DctM subunit